MANLNSQEWRDIIFADKNKDFGAYQLRKASDKRHNLAVLFTLIGLVIIAGLVYGLTKFNAYQEEQRLAELRAAAEKMSAAQIIDEPEPEPEEVEEERVEIEIPEVKEEVLATVQVTQIAIVEEEKVKNEVMEMDTQMEDNTARGVANIEGTDDVDHAKAFTEQVKTVEEPKPEPKEEQIFTAVEQQAEFPGGQQALMKWLSNNIRYPEAAQQNDIQGRVIVRFVVEKDGSVGQASVLKGVDKDLDREALRVVNKMPKWQPGKNNGVTVRSYFTLPVTFRLQNQ